MTRRFWEGVAAGGVSTVLLALTLLTPDWIEVVFHVDPDQGNGTFEWLLVAIFGAAALICLRVVQVELTPSLQKGELA